MNSVLERHLPLRQAFAQHFGSEPAVWVRAPGRVDHMGSHTDYNLGFVLTLPIHLDTWIAARPRPNRRVRLRSLNLEADAEFSLDDLPSAPVPGWSDYVRGVAAMQTMIDAMLAAPGVIGARQVGAGFGGCMVAFVETEQLDAFASSVATANFRATNIQPKIRAVEAAAGAGVIVP